MKNDSKHFPDEHLTMTVADRRAYFLFTVFAVSGPAICAGIVVLYNYLTSK